SADVNSSGRDHIAIVDQRKLGRAAADIDVEDAYSLLARNAGSARAVGGQHGFHMMASSGADEIAACRGQHSRNGLRVLPAQSFTRENDSASVDVRGLNARA